MKKIITIDDVACYSKGKQINGKELLATGKYVYMNGGVNPSGYWNDYNTCANTITISEGGNSCGFVNYINENFWCGAHCYFLYNVKGNSKYLYYSLKSQQDRLMKIRSGACMPNIKKSDLGTFSIYYDDNEISQLKIIKVLDKLKLLIEYKNKQIELLDQLIKSRFVEMFGDPILNDHNLQRATLKDIVKDIRYGTSRPAVEGGRYPYIRMNNITQDGKMDLNNLKYIDIPDSEVEKCIVKKGDILFNRTNSIDLIGKTTCFEENEEMIIAGYIIRIRLNELVLPEIIAQYMNLDAIKQVLRNMAKGAVNQANINAKEIQTLKIYLPGLEIQKQFVEFKKKIDKSKFVLICKRIWSLERLLFIIVI